MRSQIGFVNEKLLYKNSRKKLMETNYLSEFKIDMHLVKEHYIRRKNMSGKLKSLMKDGKKREYVELAVGISDPLANYSASEHQLGHRILENNSISSVYSLAQQLASTNLNVTDLPNIIYEANLPYLKISVGSEMAALLQPSHLWVGNVRTIWSHLVIKHKGDWEKANEELELYKIDDATSEMYYRIWRDIYLSMEHSLDIINSISSAWAKEQNIKSGKIKYLWVDAICSALYECE